MFSMTQFHHFLPLVTPALGISIANPVFAFFFSIFQGLLILIGAGFIAGGAWQLFKVSQGNSGLEAVLNGALTLAVGLPLLAGGMAIGTGFSALGIPGLLV